MKREQWITVQFVAAQRRQIAAWVMLCWAFNHDDPVDRIKNAVSRVVALPIIGVLVQQKIDQGDGIPYESRTVLAVRDEAEIVALNDAYSDEGLIGIYDSVDDILVERIEEVADDRREDALAELKARQQTEALWPAVAS